jgi:Bacterial mobilisation protein (MobC).
MEVKGNPSDNRTRRFEMRLTEAEHARLSKMERTLGMNRADIVRHRVFGRTAQVADARILMKQLDGLGAELGRAGNNVNQLARHANTLNRLGSLTPAALAGIDGALGNYAEVQRQIERQLRRLIRMMKEP